MLKAYLDLLRVRQYYKNLVILLPAFFSGRLLDYGAYPAVFAGLAGLCLVSSSNYVFNDIIDRKRDRLNPEKRNRPIASGAVGLAAGYSLWIALMLASLLIASTLGRFFMVLVLALSFSGIAYSLFLKDEPLADVIMISINFVIRAVSGAYAIGVYVSPWLILCPFFLALLLAIGKRDAERRLLGKNSSTHRPSLSFYSAENSKGLKLLAASLLLISYGLYCFMSVQGYMLLITLPLAVYAVLRYLSLTAVRPFMARNPEKLLRDKRILAAGVLWASCVAGIIYLL